MLADVGISRAPGVSLLARLGPGETGAVSRCASALDPLARLAKVAAAGGVALHHEIDIGIMHALAFGARADLEIDRVVPGAVDQAVRDAAACLEAGGVAGLEHGFAVVLAKDGSPSSI
jgi:hypothetical protein